MLTKDELRQLKNELLMLLHYQQKENMSYIQLLKLGRERAKKYGLDLQEIDRILRFVIEQEKKNGIAR